MFRKPSQHVFELYTHAGKPDAPLLLSTGFSFGAFLLHGFWLIYHGAWRVAVIWLVLFASINAIAGALGADESLLMLVQLSMQCWLGLEANTLRGIDARLRGYRFANVVVARDASEAEYFAYDELSMQATR